MSSDQQKAWNFERETELNGALCLNVLPKKEKSIRKTATFLCSKNVKKRANQSWRFVKRSHRHMSVLHVLRKGENKIMRS